MVHGVHIRAIKDFYRVEIRGLSVPGPTPAAALIRLFKTVANDLECSYGAKS